MIAVGEVHLGMALRVAWSKVAELELDRWMGTMKPSASYIQFWGSFRVFTIGCGVAKLFGVKKTLEEAEIVSIGLGCLLKGQLNWNEYSH